MSSMNIDNFSSLVHNKKIQYEIRIEGYQKSTATVA